MLLSRKLERCSRVKESIAFYSYKNKSMQYCESRLEANAALLREFDPVVISYLTQPSSFGYKIGSRTVRYTPDALVKTFDDRYFYEEVKPYAVINRLHVHNKYLHLKNLFDDVVGYPLVINTALSESDCCTVANLQKLYFYRCQVFDKDYAMSLVSELPKVMLVSELNGFCADRNLPNDFFWKIIANGLYGYSNDEIISSDTELELINATEYFIK